MSENQNGDTAAGELPDIHIKRAKNYVDKEKLNELSRVKRVIGVVSGKGGVGKSLVTSLLAVNMNEHGFKTAIMDADITGPSIPRAFGVHGRPEGTDTALYPMKSKNGIDLMSINFLLDSESSLKATFAGLSAGISAGMSTGVSAGSAAQATPPVTNHDQHGGH